MDDSPLTRKVTYERRTVIENGLEKKIQKIKPT